MFGQPVLSLGFLGAVLLPLGGVAFYFAADGFFVSVELFGDFVDVAVAGQVLDRVSFVLGQLCVAHSNISYRKVTLKSESDTQIKTSSENSKSGFSDDLFLLYTTYFLFFSSLNALPTTNSELRLMPNAAIQGLT